MPNGYWKYKKYGILILIVLLALLGCFLGGAFVVPPQYEQTFLGELKDKAARLHQTPGKRIVFVGGSSLAFGIDSKLLQQSFPEYDVVNYGMYAALGTTVMLDLTIDDLHDGDLVILSPEQHAQTLSDAFHAELMWQAADGAPELLCHLDRAKLDQMAGTMPKHAVQKWQYFLRQTAPNPDGVYRHNVFNSYGDVDSPLCAQNIMEGGYDKNQPILFSAECLTDAFSDAVNAYIRTAEAKGASVYYRFPPMNRLAVKEGLLQTDKQHADEAAQTELIDQYVSALLQTLDCPLIGNPNQQIMDEAWFYDTNFHLNNAGKRVNTEQLIRDLKAVRGDSSATSITLPPKPEIRSIRKASPRGDDSDAAHFLYEETESGIHLVGLTEDGQQQRMLTLPTQIDGKPVLAYAAETFANNQTIETIVIQPNITRLPDAGFADCRALKRIVLEEMKPTDCMPGQELLQDCSADVYVDRELLSQYKTNYAWALYADRLKPKE